MVTGVSLQSTSDEDEDQKEKAIVTINKEVHPNSGNESPQKWVLRLLLETMWAWDKGKPRRCSL